MTYAFLISLLDDGSSSFYRVKFLQDCMGGRTIFLTTVGFYYLIISISFYCIFFSDLGYSLLYTLGEYLLLIGDDILCLLLPLTTLSSW